ncbi:hypothetical protein ACEYW6_32555 [Nostoc sp. UIC 10607]|uniref:hypothetical protein n=1 Tax=Nostoc sp. UIC 10607 TaxID=3045935 RepID=UPI00399F0048
MSTNVDITFVNQSNDEDDSSVLVFMKPTESNFAAQSTAWQVIKNIGYNCWHKFTYTLDTSVVALWDNGNSGTFPIPTTNGKNYALKQSKGGFTLEEAGNGNAPNEFDVINKIATAHGISVVAYKDGNPILTKNTVAKGEKAEFVFHPKLYFGLNSEYEVGDTVSSAVMSEDFKEISLEGLKSITVAMTGNPANGYNFTVTDQVPA